MKHQQSLIFDENSVYSFEMEITQYWIRRPMASFSWRKSGIFSLERRSQAKNKYMSWKINLPDAKATIQNRIPSKQAIVPNWEAQLKRHDRRIGQSALEESSSKSKLCNKSYL